MIIDQQTQTTCEGVFAYPDYSYPAQPRPQSEIRETIVIRGKGTTTQAAQGTADQKE